MLSCMTEKSQQLLLKTCNMTFYIYKISCNIYIFCCDAHIQVLYPPYATRANYVVYQSKALNSLLNIKLTIESLLKNRDMFPIIYNYVLKTQREI